MTTETAEQQTPNMAIQKAAVDFGPDDRSKPSQALSARDLRTFFPAESAHEAASHFHAPYLDSSSFLLDKGVRRFLEKFTGGSKFEVGFYLSLQDQKSCAIFVVIILIVGVSSKYSSWVVLLLY